MNAVRGRVRGGRIETDAALPEGTEVVVLTGSDAEAFELDEPAVKELESRMNEPGRDIEPAESVLARLRRA